eukprot:1261981-Lingulodinium_polyedra.AAC.1
MLQETHWGTQAAAAWAAGLIPHTKVAASPARPGPRGGRQGGVAIICTAPQRLLEHRVIVPGCA